MKCIPRASFSIAILDDEDFGVLTEDPGGLEAFGLFVAIVVAGRSRLQMERAERVGDSDALVFIDRTRHLLSLVHADRDQLDRCLAAFARVAQETEGEPWLYLDDNGRLVIRSFFKFNTNTGWGGHRDGAGRKPSGNQDGPGGNQVFQDDSKRNHLDSAVQSSGLCSGTGIGTGTGIKTPLNPPKGETGVGGSSSASLPDPTPKAPPDPGAQSRPALAVDTLPDDEEPFHSPCDTKVPHVTGPGRNSAQAIELEKWARKFGRSPDGVSYAGWVRSKCDDVPPTWLNALLVDYVEGLPASSRTTTRYLGGILKRWLTTGVCDALETKVSPPSKGFQRPAPKREEVIFTAPPNFNEFFYGKKANA